ncbi:MAG: hypothetical protein Q9218_001590 [Villophora microphyllina]
MHTRSRSKVIGTRREGQNTSTTRSIKRTQGQQGKNPRSRPALKSDSNGALPIRPKKPRISKSIRQRPCRLRSADPEATPDSVHDGNEESSTKSREQYPEEFPDLDFHHSWGSFLTRKNPIAETVNPKIAQYWQLLSQNPTVLQYHIHDISTSYRKAFRDFFTAEPFSLHGHVSDASNPSLLTGLICHLFQYAKPKGKFCLSTEARSKPRIAITEGCYGAGFGPLHYHAVNGHGSLRLTANGARPVVIKTNDVRTIDAQLKAAKKGECVALMVEMVSVRNGWVMDEKIWENLVKACNKYNMFLVVDEALTSIRCGAPFAYQLPQYCQYGHPDLVLFGKAVRTNGVAIEWRGVNVAKLGIVGAEKRQYAILDWQERLTEMAPAADLLISWSTLLLAEKEKWPQRA